jgi:hypothetical protein
MTDDAVWRLIEKRAKIAGVTNVSPNDLRRSFVSLLLDAGIDVTTVSKMAGHASVLTTAKYDRQGEDAKRKARRRSTYPTLVVLAIFSPGRDPVKRYGSPLENFAKARHERRLKGSCLRSPFRSCFALQP